MVPVDEEPDPREELLRHKDAAKEFAVYTAAYRETQPKPIFAKVDEEQEDAEKKKKAEQQATSNE